MLTEGKYVDENGLKRLVKETKKYVRQEIQAGYDNTAIVSRIATLENRNTGAVVIPPPGKNRWLIFDPDNRKGLIMLAGCTVNLSKLGGEGYITLEEDTKFTINDSLIAGTEYAVKINWDSDTETETETLSLSAQPAITSNNNENDISIVGWFHTLCADAGSNLTMTIQQAKDWNVVGDNILVKAYSKRVNPILHGFYVKNVTAIKTLTNYMVLTVKHPLAGFNAGDILPESVFCTTFRPECQNIDGMVYDPETNICVDIYLMSGTGYGARSRYGQQHTVNRIYQLMAMDLSCVGKRPLYDHEFKSAAKGSNECTNIQGNSDKGTVGGHVDTAGRRMISAIGCEEMCGYLWQILAEYAAIGNNNTGVHGYGNNNASPSWYDNCDTDAKFGQNYCLPTNMLAGGDWSNGVLCGSSCRHSSSLRSHAASRHGARGACDIKIGI